MCCAFRTALLYEPDLQADIPRPYDPKVYLVGSCICWHPGTCLVAAERKYASDCGS